MPLHSLPHPNFHFLFYYLSLYLLYHFITFLKGDRSAVSLARHVCIDALESHIHSWLSLLIFQENAEECE